MKLIEAKQYFNNNSNIAFKDLFNNALDFSKSNNKGIVGQACELACYGKIIGSRHLDFEDGELKTYNAYADGRPKETIAIHQISTHTIDDILEPLPFENSILWNKVNNVLYVGIVRNGTSDNWYFLPPVHIDLTNIQYQDLKAQIQNDYYIISKLLNEMSQQGEIHTCNGTYLQIRTKDSQPYHNIFSQKYNKIISDKNRAFFFKTNYIKDYIAPQI